ncbi:hypothetical protein D9757_012749 [Collybiopsis confluens]|uniref:GH16 domain-containing protein n=1 Tax=Collybiopsis confluens TaxID=2823264 RepID=A0A8H5LPN7_9AGAR|nr:hypothetical protein D9757_012749 [Collybiopsis confluens]
MKDKTPTKTLNSRVPTATFHADPSTPTKTRPALVKIFGGFKKARRDPSTAIDSSIAQAVESSVEPPIEPPNSSSDSAITSSDEDDDPYFANDTRSVVTVPGIVPENVENPPSWFRDGPFSSLAVNPVGEIGQLNRWFLEVHVGLASDEGVASDRNSVDDDTAESIKLRGSARPRFGQSKQTGVSPAVPPTEKRSFFWRAHEQSKKFLWAFLLGNDKLMCAVTGEQAPLQSAHFLQAKCPSVTRVRIMKAVQGAFCGNSRLNLIPLTANIHIKWDADQFLVFLIDKPALEDLDAYLTFLDDRDELNELSGSAHRFVPVPEGQWERAEYYNSTLLQTQQEPVEISQGSYQTYAHPVFVVLRFMETVMSTQSRAWVEDDYDPRNLWGIWTKVASHLELLELNLKVARHLLRRMGAEVSPIWSLPRYNKIKVPEYVLKPPPMDERGLQDKQAGIVSWAAGAGGAGKGTSKGRYPKGSSRQRAVDGKESSLRTTEASLLVDGWRLENESRGKLHVLRQFRESLQVPKNREREWNSLRKAKQSQLHHQNTTRTRNPNPLFQSPPETSIDSFLNSLQMSHTKYEALMTIRLAQEKKIDTENDELAAKILPADERIRAQEKILKKYDPGWEVLRRTELGTGGFAPLLLLRLMQLFLVGTIKSKEDGSRMGVQLVTLMALVLLFGGLSLSIGDTPNTASSAGGAGGGATTTGVSTTATTTRTEPRLRTTLLPFLLRPFSMKSTPSSSSSSGELVPKPWLDPPPPSSTLSKTPFLKRIFTRKRISAILPHTLIFIGLGLGVLQCVLTYVDVSTKRMDRQSLCLVMEEDFSGGEDEVFGEGGRNGGFEMTTASSKNSYIKNGILYLAPTLTEEEIGRDNVLGLNGPYTYNMTSCTFDTTAPNSGYIPDPKGTGAKVFDYGAYYAACSATSNTTSGTVVNPVQSARISTLINAKQGGNRSVRYGRLRFGRRCLLALWMLPMNNTYGSWPRSGEIDIVGSRGNGLEYTAHGANYVQGALNWGPTPELNSVSKSYSWWSDKRVPFSRDFHTYVVEWTTSFLRIYVDTRLHTLLEYQFNQPFFQKGDYPDTTVNSTTGQVQSLQDPRVDPTTGQPKESAKGRWSAPFDQVLCPSDVHVNSASTSPVKRTRQQGQSNPLKRAHQRGDADTPFRQQGENTTESGNAGIPTADVVGIVSISNDSIFHVSLKRVSLLAASFSSFIINVNDFEQTRCSFYNQLRDFLFSRQIHLSLSTVTIIRRKQLCEVYDGWYTDIVFLYPISAPRKPSKSFPLPPEISKENPTGIGNMLTERWQKRRKSAARELLWVPLEEKRITLPMGSMLPFPSDDQKQNPAFSIFPNSAAGSGSNMLDLYISAPIELQHPDHKRQRTIRRTWFKHQTWALQRTRELFLLPFDTSSSDITRTSGTPLAKGLIGGLSVQGPYPNDSTGGTKALLPDLSSGRFENDFFNFNGIPDESYTAKGYGIPARGLHSSHGAHGTSESMVLLGRGFGSPSDGANIDVCDGMNCHRKPEDKRRDVDGERKLHFFEHRVLLTGVSAGDRFANIRFQDIAASIHTLCRDQRGCRYLQKKLGEEIPEYRDVIFYNVIKDFADLMTDPIGKYLCLKLLEYSTDNQKNVIGECVARDLTRISLNMHGTRAIQKMIDFLSSKRNRGVVKYNRQINSIIIALSAHVVVLMKDLNGSHVVQRCLNKLSPEENQVIYKAVAANCVEIATDRHGSCVLQRCIDNVSGYQRIQLISEIILNASALVQDPYGNYCIRVAGHSAREMLIEEFLNCSQLEKLLRDAYGNYCVQTALDHAAPIQYSLLTERIRPILPLIHNSPYSKRIETKLHRPRRTEFGGCPSGLGQALVNTELAGQSEALNVTKKLACLPKENADVYDTFLCLQQLQLNNQSALMSQFRNFRPRLDLAYGLHGPGMYKIEPAPRVVKAAYMFSIESSGPDVALYGAEMSQPSYRFTLDTCLKVRTPKYSHQKCTVRASSGSTMGKRRSSSYERSSKRARPDPTDALESFITSNTVDLARSKTNKETRTSSSGGKSSTSDPLRPVPTPQGPLFHSTPPLSPSTQTVLKNLLDRLPQNDEDTASYFATLLRASSRSQGASKKQALEPPKLPNNGRFAEQEDAELDEDEQDQAIRKSADVGDDNESDEANDNMMLVKDVTKRQKKQPIKRKRGRKPKVLLKEFENEDLALLAKRYSKLFAWGLFSETLKTMAAEGSADDMVRYLKQISSDTDKRKDLVTFMSYGPSSIRFDLGKESSAVAWLMQDRRYHEGDVDFNARSTNGLPFQTTLIGGILRGYFIDGKPSQDEILVERLKSHQEIPLPLIAMIVTLIGNAIQEYAIGYKQITLLSAANLGFHYTAIIKTLKDLKLKTPAYYDFLQTKLWKEMNTAAPEIVPPQVYNYDALTAFALSATNRETLGGGGVEEENTIGKGKMKAIAIAEEEDGGDDKEGKLRDANLRWRGKTLAEDLMGEPTMILEDAPSFD